MPRGARLDRRERIGDAERHVVMAVKADLGRGGELLTQQPDSRGDIVGQHVPGRIRAVDDVRAVAFHQPGLREQLSRFDHVRHHEEADGVESELARERDVLLGDVRLGAMRGDADGGDAAVLREVQVLDRADTGQQQRRDLGSGELRDHTAQVLLVAVRRESVVDRGAAQAVAVSDLDQRHTGGVERGRHRHHLFERDAMRLRVHAVAQAHVVQHDLLSLEVHVGSPGPRRPWAVG